PHWSSARTSCTASSSSADANDLAPQPRPAPAAKVDASPEQLPLAVLRVLRQAAADLRPGDAPAEVQNAHLVLAAVAAIGPRRDDAVQRHHGIEQARVI